MATIAANLQAVKQRIDAAAKAAGRPAETVRLIAVSKTFPAAAVLEAVAAGQQAFGENYLQEALDKQAAVAAALASTGSNAATATATSTAAPLEWHFIGPIQSNKTRPIAEHFDWVHSVDRAKVAERLAAQRPAHLAPLNVCIQVNISGEDSKSGIAPAAAAELARTILALPGLRLRGLMAIPEPSDDATVQRASCARLRELAQALAAAGIACPELSMGMSADLEAAVAEGATMVRIGSAIFGARTYA